MAKFRKKPVVIEASRWYADGDHPAVVPYVPQVTGTSRSIIVLQTTCHYCSRKMEVHGWIQTLEGGHIVCPGDWIITGVKNEKYPCKADIFEATYEPA